MPMATASSRWRCAVDSWRATRSAVLYAGAGIVDGSRWQDEWRETEVKLEPMRRALGLTDHHMAAGLRG